MARILPRRSWSLLLAALLVAAPLAVSAAASAAHIATHRQQMVEVSLSQFGFEPGVIEVNEGDTVTLVLNATDVAHGFFVDGYGIDVPVIPGKKVSYTFVASMAGHFHIRCSLNCGTFHPYMLGRLEVRENSNFYLAASAAVGISALALAFGWRPEGGLAPPGPGKH